MAVTESMTEESAADERALRRGIRGCLGALVLAPLAGVTAGLVLDPGTGVLVGLLLFAGLAALSLIGFARAGQGRSGPTTWSFTPLGAGLIAATDVVAAGGDAFGPGTFLLVSLPCAAMGAGLVFLTEMRESRRLGLSLVKAAVAGALIAIPLPVGGLVGAGASLGHRALFWRPDAESDQPRS